ncbi:MAG: hypothetical protein QF463_04740 [Vicinamibacterales bacterium]|nr:hypothetical protein [Vicinamibacterales bacterium]MDP6608354.1 hypothetical protein [Vicinamibacterales bacterium]
MTSWAVAACSLVLVLAQSPDGLAQSRSRWWQSEEVQQELRLSPDAASRIDEIYEAEMPIQRSGWREFNRLEKAFDKLLEREDVTEAEVSHELEHLEAARAELRKSRTLMLFRMQRVLTAEQRLLLDAYNKRRRDERRQRDSGAGDRRRRL